MCFLSRPLGFSNSTMCRTIYSKGLLKISLWFLPRPPTPFLTETWDGIVDQILSDASSTMRSLIAREDNAGAVMYMYNNISRIRHPLPQKSQLQVSYLNRLRNYLKGRPMTISTVVPKEDASVMGEGPRASRGSASLTEPIRSKAAAPPLPPASDLHWRSRGTCYRGPQKHSMSYDISKSKNAYFYVLFLRPFSLIQDLTSKRFVLFSSSVLFI